MKKNRNNKFLYKKFCNYSNNFIIKIFIIYIKIKLNGYSIRCYK